MITCKKNSFKNATRPKIINLGKRSLKLNKKDIYVNNQTELILSGQLKSPFSLKNEQLENSMRNENNIGLNYSIRSKNNDKSGKETITSKASNLNNLYNNGKNYEESQAVSLSMNSETVKKQIPGMRYEMTEINLANKFSKERLNIKELAKKLKSSNKNKSSLNKTNDTSIPERLMKNIISSEKAKLMSTTTNHGYGESINNLLINSDEHEDSKKLKYMTANNSIK